MALKESKEDAFKRVGQLRTKRILKDLELLENLCNRHNYSYTQVQIEKIFSAIESQLQATKNKFSIHQSKDFRL